MLQLTAGEVKMPTKNIDESTKAILDEFLEKFIYPSILDKDNLLGVITYGSSTTGFSSKNSDIDLLIILNYAEKSTRSVKLFKGRKIEYFIKPIEKFLSEGVKFAKTNCPSHVALEQNAYFLYDRNDLIANMLKADAQFYNENRSKPNLDFNIKLVQIENRIASLKNILERNGKEFHMVYFNILEMIRDLHSKNHEEAEIPFAKAYRIYTDKKYYDKFVSSKASNPLPDKIFVKLYTRCVEEYQNKTQMMQNLQDLFDYEKNHYSINPQNYEIDYL